jgi:hypothetical protein
MQNLGEIMLTVYNDTTVESRMRKNNYLPFKHLVQNIRFTNSFSIFNAAFFFQLF